MDEIDFYIGGAKMGRSISKWMGGTQVSRSGHVGGGWDR